MSHLQRVRDRVTTTADKGFTLIELLIVIVILGILAGIAILAVDQFQNDAGEACRDANTRIDDTIDAANDASDSTYTKEGADCPEAPAAPAAD